MEHMQSKRPRVAHASTQATSPAGTAEQLAPITLQDVAAVPGLGALIMGLLPLPDRVRLRGLCCAFASSVDASLQDLQRIGRTDLLALDKWGRSNGDVLTWLASKCPNLQVLEAPGKDLQPWWKYRIADTVVTQLATRCWQLHTLDLSGCRGVRDASLQAVAANCPELRDLNVSGCKRVTDAGIVAIATLCRQLDRLNVEFTFYLTAASMLALAAYCPSLQHLRTYGVDVGSDGLVAVSRGCPLLRTLCADEADLNDDVVVAVAENCPLLESLDCEDSLEVGDMGNAALLLHCLQLKKLSLGYNVTDAAIRLGPDSGRELRSLHIATSETLSDVAIHGLAARCGKLTSLKLYNRQVMTNPGVLVVTDATIAAFAASCPHLETLVISSGDQVTDAGVLAVAQNCPRLREVDLGWCQGVTDVSLVELARRCGGLQVLDFRHTAAGNRTVLALAQHCPDLRQFSAYSRPPKQPIEGGSEDSHVALQHVRLKDDGLVAVLHNCLQLERLDLRPWRGLSDAGIRMAGDSCKRLRELVLSGCQGCFTDRGLATMAPHLGALQNLNAWECDAVTDGSVAALATHCPLLQNVDVSHTSVGDEGIAALARLCPLVTLRAEHCKGVTDAGISAIGEHCSQLDKLWVAGCEGVTIPAAMALLRKCRWLSVLDILCSSQTSDSTFKDVKRLCPRMKRCVSALLVYISSDGEERAGGEEGGGEDA
eukprot:jgi/Mesvir1/14880/Mv05489-RA.1